MHTLYLGGTSITKGGGLENEEFRQDIRPLYFALILSTTLIIQYLAPRVGL